MSNFGIGIYFLTVMWLITLLLCWVSFRTGHWVGKVSVCICFLLTVVLVSLPRGVAGSADIANFYDRLFVARYAVLSLLVASGAAGSVYCFVHVCLAPLETIKAKALGSIN